MNWMNVFGWAAAFTASATFAHAQQYLGCHRDQGDPTGTQGRDLSGFVLNDAGMTTSRCLAECASRRFAYAATQYGSWCFCGNSYGKSGPAGNCDMPCSGNRSEICGGAWANSVYQVATVVDDCAECARQKCPECQNAIILLCEVSEGPGVDAAACNACMKRQGCK